MFKIDLEKLIVEHDGRFYYRVPVLAICWRSFWEMNQVRLDPNKEVKIEQEGNSCTVFVPQEKVAKIIATSCGDPRKLYA